MRTVLGIFICLSLHTVNGQVRVEKITDRIKPVDLNSRFVVPSALSYSASFEGTHSYERVGYSLSGVGDVNGDGYDDFVIGNTHTNLTHPQPDKGDAGSVHLILGGPSEFGMSVSLEDADARFTGKNKDDAVGLDIGSRGDVNGDGLKDILIGAPAKVSDTPDNHGRAFLVFGRTAADWGYDFVLEDQADASFVGEATAYITGQSVDIIGDLNSDGYDEFIIGAPLADDEALDRGKIYFFRGQAQGWERDISVTDADAIFYGDVDYGQAGYRTKGVGDVNGDGIPDFAIGNKNLVGTGGQVFLIFGRSNMDWGTSFQLSDADVIITGEDPNTPGWAGWQIAPAGDVNGDDLDDFLIGDRWYSTYQGKVGLFFGKRSGWRENVPC